MPTVSDLVSGYLAAAGGGGGGGPFGNKSTTLTKDQVDALTNANGGYDLKNAPWVSDGSKLGGFQIVTSGDMNGTGENAPLYQLIQQDNLAGQKMAHSQIKDGGLDIGTLMALAAAGFVAPELLGALGGAAGGTDAALMDALTQEAATYSAGIGGDAATTAMGGMNALDYMGQSIVPGAPSIDPTGQFFDSFGNPYKTAADASSADSAAKVASSAANADGGLTVTGGLTPEQYAANAAARTAGTVPQSLINQALKTGFGQLASGLGGTPVATPMSLSGSGSGSASGASGNTGPAQQQATAQQLAQQLTTPSFQKLDAPTIPVQPVAAVAALQNNLPNSMLFDQAGATWNQKLAKELRGQNA